MNTRRFTHKFRNGVTATLSYDLDGYRPGAGHAFHTHCEWSAKPTKRMLAEYVRWKHAVCDQLAKEVNGTVMDVIQTKRDSCEIWIHKPGVAGFKQGEALWPVI